MTGGALGFLTILGRGEHARPSARTLVWFGPVGAVVGAIVGLAGWGAAELWPAVVAGATMVAVDGAVTGLLHLDGLADAGDGLIGPMESPARRLDVMSTPDVGAFGVATVGIVLAVRTAGLIALVPLAPGWRLPAVLAAWWAASRAAMAIALLTQPPARPGGMTALFGCTRSERTARLAGVAIASLPLAVVAAYAGRQWAGVAGIAGVGVGTIAVLVLARRRIGGITGDVLGAAGVIGETVAILAGSAHR